MVKRLLTEIWIWRQTYVTNGHIKLIISFYGRLYSFLIVCQISKFKNERKPRGAGNPQASTLIWDHSSKLKPCS